jgi:DNA end-binding protein Ku
MDALRQSTGQASPSPGKPARKSRKASAGQNEMLMPIQDKKAAKEAAKGMGAKMPATKPQRRSA